MKRSDISIKSVLLALLGVLLLLLLVMSIEFYDEKVETNWSFEALFNPFLAAEQFISESGVEVVDAVSLGELDSFEAIGTIFITDADIIASERQLDDVMGWLESGGNIILSVDSTSDSDALLMQKIGVEVKRSEPKDSDDDAPEHQSISDRLRDYNRQIEEGVSREEIADIFKPEVTITTIGFGGETGDLEVAFDTSRILSHVYIDDEEYDELDLTPNSWSSSDYGVHLMQFNVGEGLLTLVSDNSIWTSYRIDEYDHAYLLWVLSDQSGSFAALRPVVRDSLWESAKKHTLELLVAIAATLALWLWFVGHRFGRITLLESGMSRSMGEHFISVTGYLWHRKKANYLLASLRQKVLRRAGVSIGEFSQADQQRQLELLALRTERSALAIDRALYESDFNETSFVQAVKLLKHIEQSL